MCLSYLHASTAGDEHALRSHRPDDIREREGRENYGETVAGVGEKRGSGVLVTAGVRVGDGIRDGVKVTVGIAVGASPCKIN